MITTNDTYMVISGDKTNFVGAPIYSVPTVHKDPGKVHIEMRILQADTAVDTGVLLRHTLEFTNAEILAFTSSGANEIAKFYNQCEQAVKDYLEDLNGGDTFTIV